MSFKLVDGIYLRIPQFKIRLKNFIDIRGLPFIFRHFAIIYLAFLTYERYLCCLQYLKRFVSPKKWNSIVNIFVRKIQLLKWINLNNSASMNLIQLLAMKLPQGPVFIDGMVNLTEVVAHSKTNFVKVVQNQLLLRKPLMPCDN